MNVTLYQRALQYTEVNDTDSLKINFRHFTSTFVRCNKKFNSRITRIIPTIVNFLEPQEFLPSFICSFFLLFSLLSYITPNLHSCIYLCLLKL